MVVDPVCQMVLDPAVAAASTEFEGERVYFCSDACCRRFAANPGAYKFDSSSSRTADVCAHSTAGERPWHPVAFISAASIGLFAAAILLSIYFGVLTLVSGWEFTIEQFGDYWPFITALAIGFGIQVGLFVYLRSAVHAATSGKVLAATGTTSGAAMVSCCTHYLVDLLPALGATGLVTFIGTYQIELFWFGIASNLAGIGYIGRRLVLFAQGA